MILVPGGPSFGDRPVTTGCGAIFVAGSGLLYKIKVKLTIFIFHKKKTNFQQYKTPLYIDFRVASVFDNI